MVKLKAVAYCGILILIALCNQIFFFQYCNYNIYLFTYNYFIFIVSLIDNSHAAPKSCSPDMIMNIQCTPMCENFTSHKEQEFCAHNHCKGYLKFRSHCDLMRHNCKYFHGIISNKIFFFRLLNLSQ